MEEGSKSHDLEYEDEYVLLDLDEVIGHVCIPPNAPYTLSGLDTLHPVLIIDNKLKLIGEYEETIGTCVVFDEDKKSDSKSKSSKANTSKQAMAKEVRPVGCLQKVLKFRIPSEEEEDDQANNTIKRLRYSE